MEKNNLAKLGKVLAYSFTEQELLNTALRHRSMKGVSNERMEFLGDAVLGLVIAAELFHKYPQLQEGELSRLRANLVRKEQLAELAKKFKLGDYLYLGIGERKTDGFRRASILADAMEAVIGAIYLDSNFTICQQTILKWYAKKLTDLADARQKDAKSCLQEYLQANKLALPIYEITDTKGKVHEQVFYIECKVEGLKTVTKGKGNSKQEAEQNAAQKFLKKIKDQQMVDLL